MNGIPSFSADLFAILVYCLEMGDVGSRMVVANTVLANYTDDVTTAFFYSIFQTSAGITYVGKVTIFFWAGPFVDKVLV